VHQQDVKGISSPGKRRLWRWHDWYLVEGVGLQPLVLVVGAVRVGVVDEVGRRSDLIVDANIARLLDGGRGDLVRLRKHST
jgi:hypothetical protein